MATRRDAIRALNARHGKRAVGDADAVTLKAAAEQDGATFVRGSSRARAHVRKAPPSERAAALELPEGVRGVVGAPTRVLVSSREQDALQGAWAVVEAADLVTSHDARTFRPHPAYPEGVQERAYHRDPYEQRKVSDHAARLVADFLVNTNPDSVNGAPVVVAVAAGEHEPRTREDGSVSNAHAAHLIVLGGNSRAMSLQRAYSDGNAAAYRALLVERSRVFGLAPRQLDGMAAPVLVRVVEAEPARWRDLSRTLNETQTQEKRASDDAVSLSHRLSPETLAVLGDSVNPDETLTAYLSSPRARALVRRLLADRVITETTAGRLLVGLDLSEDGRTLVERALVARIIPDAATIERMGARRRETVARAVPAIFDARRHGHDVSDDLRAALEDLADADARGLSLAQLEAQGSMFALTATRSRTPESIALRALLEESSRRFVRALRTFALAARSEPAGQTTLLGAPRSTAEILTAAIEAS